MKENRRVLLVFPSLKQSAPNRPPLGVLTLAAALSKKGIDATLLDENVDPAFETKLRSELRNDHICVGVSSMTGPQIASALRISRIIRDASPLPVVWGGVHPSLEPRATIAHDLVDMIVVGDGEETFPKLVKCLEQQDQDLEQIPGIAFKSKGAVIFTEPAPPADIDRLPSIPFHLADLDKYATGSWQFDFSKDERCRRTRGPQCILPMETSRGCPFSCSFCTESVRKKKWRALPPERVVADIEHYVERYGIRHFTFVDDNMFGDVKRGEEIIDLLAKKELDIKWYTNIRADYLVRTDSGFIRKLEKTGCRCLTFGAESGSERILKMISKRSNVKTTLAIGRKLAGSKIHPSFVAIKGFPTETRKDITQTYLLILQILLENSKAMCSLPSLIPTPGTKMAGQCLGKKMNDYTLEDWSRRWIAVQTQKPPWVLEETFAFISKYRFIPDIIAGISWIRGKKTITASNIFQRLLLKFCRFSLKSPLVETTRLYKLWNRDLILRVLNLFPKWPQRRSLDN